MKVTNRIETSHLQSLIDLQYKAEQLKPRALSLTDQIAHWYVIILLLLVCLSAIYWSQVNPEQTFAVVLSVLVVSCPCALSLATPAVIAAATSRLSDLGLMLRTTTAFEDLNKINRVYFDKTGTLTTGKMKITKTIVHSDTSLEPHSINDPKDRCLQIAEALERVSNHPIAHAFKRHESSATFRAEELTEQPGRGVSGMINGVYYRLGNSAFMRALNIEIEEPTNSKCTRLYLAKKNKLLATFTLEDTLKDSSKPTISTITDQGYQIGILSGDAKNAVSSIAQQLAISDFHFAMSPEGKLNFIHKKQNSGENCMMIGDGFNDVGALTASKMSITVGTGTQLSKNASGAVLVSKDLTVIAKALAISKKVKRVIKQNLGLAISYNLLAVPFAMMGLVPAWLAAIGMSLSSLIVVLNALRLRNE